MQQQPQPPTMEHLLESELTRVIVLARYHTEEARAGRMTPADQARRDAEMVEGSVNYIMVLCRVIGATA